MRTRKEVLFESQSGGGERAERGGPAARLRGSGGDRGGRAREPSAADDRREMRDPEL